MPFTSIERIIKIFNNKKYLDKLKQALQFSDIKKDGACQEVNIERRDTLIGMYLAKLAWYYLSYVHEGVNSENVIQLEKGFTVSSPAFSNHNIPHQKKHLATHEISFRDSTKCIINLLLPDSDNYDEYDDMEELKQLGHFLNPITRRAEEILEGRESECFSQDVCIFWKENQEKLDIRSQLEKEISRLGYRYSPNLAAIEEALRQ